MKQKSCPNEFTQFDQENLTKLFSKLIKASISEVVNPKLEALQVSIDRANARNVYTVKEVAAIVGKKPATIRIHIENGLLNASKNGRDYSINQEQLNTYLNKSN